MNFDKLFESLQNQSFRRKWIKQALVYLSDWANYLSNPEVYQRLVYSIIVQLYKHMCSSSISYQINIKKC